MWVFRNIAGTPQSDLLTFLSRELRDNLYHLLALINVCCAQTSITYVVLYFIHHWTFSEGPAKVINIIINSWD